MKNTTPKPPPDTPRTDPDAIVKTLLQANSPLALLIDVLAAAITQELNTLRQNAALNLPPLPPRKISDEIRADKKTDRP